mmetsp:Transcript_34643/g.71505  ORF Transcript_34643/g.71505 Transcript_34643/m.71505 type:complete len:288 (+) Transcript_34643:107-970(+)
MGGTSFGQPPLACMPHTQRHGAQTHRASHPLGQPHTQVPSSYESHLRPERRATRAARARAGFSAASSVNHPPLLLLHWILAQSKPHRRTLVTVGDSWQRLPRKLRYRLSPCLPKPGEPLARNPTLRPFPAPPYINISAFSCRVGTPPPPSSIHPPSPPKKSAPHCHTPSNPHNIAHRLHMSRGVKRDGSRGGEQRRRGEGVEVKRLAAELHHARAALRQLEMRPHHVDALQRLPRQHHRHRVPVRQKRRLPLPTFIVCRLLCILLHHRDVPPAVRVCRVWDRRHRGR